MCVFISQLLLYDSGLFLHIVGRTKNVLFDERVEAHSILPRLRVFHGIGRVFSLQE